VVFHAKLLTSCRAAVGLECVPKRDEIANISLQGLFSELDRAAVDDDMLRGISFLPLDAAQLPRYEQSHIYIFDRVFSRITLEGLAPVLQRSPFWVMVSSKPPRLWWACGLSKVQPVAKLRFVTTGRERMTCFVYVNVDFLPGAAREVNRCAH